MTEGRLGASAAEPIRELRAVGRQARAMRVTAHRPWPLPSRPWIMGQTWERLLFAHWPLEARELRPHVPAELELDEHDGSAWLGITPFDIRALHLRGLPPLPVGSRFHELNVRTYVSVDGRPGIWFFSLDASSIVAVTAARLTYGLPYHHAAMAAEPGPEGIRYRSERLAGTGAGARLEAAYGPAGGAFRPAAGTLAHFLAERYRLYRVDAARRVFHADIHHPPWCLQPAWVRVERNSLLDHLGFRLPAQPPVTHFAGRQDTVIWAPARMR